MIFHNRVPFMPAILRLLPLLLIGLLPLRVLADTGAPLFEFVATNTDEKSVNFSSLRGKPLVVNFWARWCGPCRKEIPDLVEMDAKYRSHGIVILGVAIEEIQSRSAVRDFAKGYGVDYQVFLAGTSKGVDLMTALGNNKSALPFTVVIDRKGTLVAQKLGAMTKAEMTAAIETALK